jgi:large subunit ribosomal protein L35
MSHANRRHILNKKTTKRKRSLRQAAFAGVTNAPTVKVLIPYK